MERKRCGDCIFYHGIYGDCGVCTLCETDETFDKTCDFVYSCKKFEPAPNPTNLDMIRQMNDKDLIKVLSDGCPPFSGNSDKCKHPDPAFSCKDCWRDWLNAPAESHAIQNVIKDGAKNAIDIHEDAYAPDMNVATKESEV